jgi:ABC-2 type transport system ATP-binding protein
MLTVASFRKSFGNRLILDVPSLQFAPGVHWIKGKNGSGKSTFFNCLAGLSPYQGSIKLHDFDLRNDAEAYKLHVNYSASEPAFPEFLTGDDLIGFFARLKQAEVQEVERLKALLGVAEYAATPCGSYSSGMLKKLSILLAFLGKPEWIILDEPLITLDKEAQQIVTDLILQKQQEDISFLFATHQDFENAYILPTDTYEVKNRQIIQLK